MIPNIPASALPDADLLDRPEPSHTYKLDFSSKRIVGMTDGQQAVTQMIYKTLQTERYAWMIYDWSYGLELEQYLGLPFDYIMADIERSITDALMVDDRVQEIRNFTMRKTRIDALYVEFTAVTTEGDTKIGWEVKLP